MMHIDVAKLVLEAYNQGKAEGHNLGWAAGYDEGFSDGKAEGYDEAIEDSQEDEDDETVIEVDEECPCPSCSDPQYFDMGWRDGYEREQPVDTASWPAKSRNAYLAGYDEGMDDRLIEESKA